MKLTTGDVIDALALKYQGGDARELALALHNWLGEQNIELLQSIIGLLTPNQKGAA